MINLHNDHPHWPLGVPDPWEWEDGSMALSPRRSSLERRYNPVAGRRRRTALFPFGSPPPNDRSRNLGSLGVPGGVPPSVPAPSAGSGCLPGVGPARTPQPNLRPAGRTFGLFPTCMAVLERTEIAPEPWTEPPTSSFCAGDCAGPAGILNLPTSASQKKKKARLATRLRRIACPEKRRGVCDIRRFFFRSGLSDKRQPALSGAPQSSF